MVTFEDQVLPEGHEAIANGILRENRHSYRYANGSEIVLGGLDKPDKVMSAEYDIVYIQEAVEVSKDAWEKCGTRLRNRKLRYQQLIADCNPDVPTHWLKLRCDVGTTKMYQSRHEENPILFDQETGLITEFGRDYLAGLDALTGPRYHRLRKGLWVTAEGAIYDEFDKNVHVIPPFDVPDEWPRLWVVDFGFKNPFVWQVWAFDPLGRMYLIAEFYHTGCLTEDVAARMREYLKVSPRPFDLVCDHDAEDRATLERHSGIKKTSGAKKAVSTGIQAVKERLRIAADGKPRMFVFDGCLMHPPDPVLVKAFKPTSTAQEFEGYVWDPHAKAERGDVPLKLNDHGMDAARYGAMATAIPKRKLKVY